MLINDIFYFVNPNKRKQIIDSRLQTAVIFLITMVTGLISGLIFALFQREHEPKLHKEMTSFEKILIFEISAFFGAVVGGINETLRKQVTLIFASVFFFIFQKYV